MRKLLILFYKYFTNFKRKIVLSGYDRFTICDYFKKQGVQVGEGCSILTDSLGDEPYLVKIGNNVTIAGGVTFVTHDGGIWVFRKEIPNIQIFGPIIIEDNCVIGQNAVLFPNIRIGKNSIIGAGSVVISDVPENTIVIGVPARPFGSVEKYKEKCIAKWHEQRPPDCVIEDGRNWWNSKHYKENREKLKRHLICLFFEHNQKE
ncbi:MAG: acyltransferase [Candidatus Omnitrophica bacterium]|nr:acyltransferase [Candidatus Omnitrophota bacterium]